MGGSVGKSKNNSSNQSSFSQTIPQFQQDALKSLYGSAASLYSGFLPQIQGMTPQAIRQLQGVFSSSAPAWQQQMQGGAFKDLNANSVYNSINSSINTPSNMQAINSMIMGGSGNNYADAMKNQYIQDANKASENMLSNLDARAAAAGMSGGSRHGIATAQGFNDINRNLQSNLAQTGFNTFDKDLDRKLNIASQADQAILARQQMMSSMLGQKQAAMQGGLNYGQNMQNLGMGSFAPLMMPWQGLQNYAATIGSPTVLSSGRGYGSGSGKGFSTSGGIGGGK